MDHDVAERTNTLWGLRSWTAARWREYGFRLVLELLVVFVGVYLASAFGRFQQEKANDARRHQIRQALIREIESIVVNTRRAAAGVRQTLAVYEASARRKEFLSPQPQLEPVRFQTHMWEATLQSGALDLFEVSTVYELSEFYNQLNDGFEQLSQLRELSERMLLPMAGSPASEYYDLATGRPKPKYVWYFDGMQNLARLADDITSRGDAVIEEMRKQDGIDDTRMVTVGGVRAEVTLRHLVPPQVFKDLLPAGTRALTLGNQDLDSTGKAITQANPALLDHGVAILSVVQSDSFTVQGRSTPGAYALWWLYAVETTGTQRRILVPLAEWHVQALTEGPMRAARRPTTTASIEVQPAPGGGWTVRLTGKDLQIQGSCIPGQFSPAQPTDVLLRSATQHYMQQGGERARCEAKWTVSGTHPLAAALRTADGAPASVFQSTSAGRGWRARVSGDPGR